MPGQRGRPRKHPVAQAATQADKPDTSWMGGGSNNDNAQEEALEESAKTVRRQMLNIAVPEIRRAEFYLIGDTPLIYNSMTLHAEKAGEFLFPGAGRRHSGELKHDPINEYRRSIYRREENAETRLVLPGFMFKAAMLAAALTIPGLKKTDTGKMVRIFNENVSIYGVPQMLMAIVRDSGQTHAPDVRTRAIVPKWCCKINVGYFAITLNGNSIFNLVDSAGMLCGVGDGRPEKGRLNYGTFHITNPDDPAYQQIAKDGGWKPQDTALNTPDFYNPETRDLYQWFQDEVERRGKPEGGKRRLKAVE